MGIIRKKTVRATFGIVALLSASAALAQGYSFQTITPPQGFNLHALSNDGSTILGTDGEHSYIWRAASGWQTLPLQIQAFGLSADGGEALGSSDYLGHGYPAVWTQATGTVRLPIPKGEWGGTVVARSKIGGVFLVAAGPYDGSSSSGFLYTDAGYTDIGWLNPSLKWTFANTISGDGSTVVGAGHATTDPTTGWHLFRWTKASGLQDLGPTFRFTVRSMAFGNADCSVIFGVSPPTNNIANYSFRWTKAGREDLGAVIANECTDDGDVAIGQDSSSIDDCLWIKGIGAIDLTTYLQQQGLDITGGDVLGYSIGTQFISGDGTVIVGFDFSQWKPYILTTPGFFVAIPDSYSVNGDATLKVAAPGVLANDTNTNRGSATLVTGPSNAGAFTLNADGSFSYTPKIGFVGSDSFTYEITKNGYASNVATATIQVIQPPKLATFNLSTGNIYMCSEFTGTATLDHATGNPIYVNVVSSNPSVVSVAANPYIPTGGTSTTIYFYANQLSGFDYQRVTITASYGGVSIARQINVFPIPLKSLTAISTTLHSGQGTMATVTLNIAPSKLPVVVQLTTSSSALSAPATVSVPPGKASASFRITANTVLKPQVVQLSALECGHVLPLSITVDP